MAPGTGAAAFLAAKGIGVLIAPEVGPKAAAALMPRHSHRNHGSGKALGEAWRTSSPPDINPAGE